MVRSACKKIGALLFCVPLSLDGYFVPPGLSESGKTEIYVNSRLSEDLQIATAVHEIKHAAFDYPLEEILFSYRGEWTIAARYQMEKYRRYEYEACAMGALALITEPRLKHASRGLFDVDDEFIADVWLIRLDVRSTHGI